MTTYARVVDNLAVDVTTIDPASQFHEDIAAQFVTVPDGTETGDMFDGEDWTKRPVPAPSAAATPPTVTPPQFKLLILPELSRILETAKTDSFIAAFISVVDDPRLTEVNLSLQSTQQGLEYCLSAIDLTSSEIAARMAQILTGKIT